MTSVDTNVSNYTLSELMAIIQIDNLNINNIVEKTNYYIVKYKNKNPTMSVFFKDIQSQLLQFAQGLEPESISKNSQGKILVESINRKKQNIFVTSKCYRFIIF